LAASAVTEEREALMIKALVAHGDATEARACGALSRAFSRSLFAPAVDEAVRSIPEAIL